MFALLRSDLYRFTRLRCLRGRFWQYAIAAVVINLIPLLLFAYATNVRGFDPGLTLDVNRVFSTPLALFSVLAFAGFCLLPLIVSYAGLDAFFEDLDAGYVKNICSSTLGRVGYAVEKVVFVGVIALMGFALLFPLALLTALLTGAAFAAYDTAGVVCSWFACALLITWAIACIPLALGLLARWKPLAYVVPLIVLFGVVPDVLRLLAERLPADAGMVSAVLASMANWMPSQAMVQLAGNPADLLGPVNMLGVPSMPGWAYVLVVALSTLLLSASALVVVARRKSL